jgi:hypothetical protein
MALTIWLRGNEWFDRVGTKSCAHPTKSEWFSSRYSAPSIAAFDEMGPTGERQEAARFRRARDGPSKTLVKSEKHRKQAESGPPFLWLLSSGEAKESSSVVGPRTDIQINPSR